MREAYRAELDRLDHQVDQLVETADHAMSWATSALLHADGSVADAVTSEEHGLDDLHHQLEDLVLSSHDADAAPTPDLGDEGQPWTSHCSVATTSATPTTPSPWPGALASSPAAPPRLSGEWW